MTIDGFIDGFYKNAQHSEKALLREALKKFKESGGGISKEKIVSFVMEQVYQNSAQIGDAVMNMRQGHKDCLGNLMSEMVTQITRKLNDYEERRR